MSPEQPEAAAVPPATAAAAVAAAVPPLSPPPQPALHSPFELAAATAGLDGGSRRSSPTPGGLNDVPQQPGSGTTSTAPTGQRSGGGDGGTGPGPRLALQESLRRRSESATSDRVPPLPPAGSSRPTSAASQYSLEAQSFHSTGSRAGGRRPSVRRSASAASNPSSHSSALDGVLSQVTAVQVCDVAGCSAGALQLGATPWWPAFMWLPAYLERGAVCFC